MPIKRPSQGNEQVRTAGRIKRVEKQAAGEGFTTKEDLEGHLIVVTVKEFNPKHVGSYGPTNKVIVDVIDLDNNNAVFDGVWFFSNLAGQIGKHLKEGESGVGKIESGPTKNGSGTWWGFNFSDDESEIERAEAALSTEEIPY